MAEDNKQQLADLSNLNGISDARERLYNQLETGKITEQKGLALERVLRGQTELKATVPLRLLAIIAKAKNPGVQKYGGALLKNVLSFTTGLTTEALEQQVAEEE